jgi:excisionase family DNA binding protein
MSEALTGGPVSELLTTRQVQELLQVDRTTVYRLVASGQLPAIRVGNQWRFVRAELESRVGVKDAPGASQVPSTEFRKAKADPAWRSVSLTGIQSLQDTMAELLGVMLVVTDMEGRAITQPSNVCGYYRALSQGGGMERLCEITWPKLAAAPSLKPEFVTSDLGPLCTRGLVRMANHLEGMLVAGCIAPDTWPPRDEVVRYAAGKAGASPAHTLRHLEEVHHLSEAERDRVLHVIQRTADIISQIIAEHLALLDRP